MPKPDERIIKIPRQPVAESVDAAELLDDTRDFIGRFCVFPDLHCLAAVTLWAAHAHMVEHFHTTPRLAMLSPEAESGKTRVLEVLELLVPEPMFTLNASPPAIFRTLANERITLLFDEVDAIWSKRGKDDNHEDLRALLNAGYKVGATIPRCVGPRHDVTRFAVFCAVALAGLGALPDTIMSRSVIVRMRRRAPHEKVESFRNRKHEPIGHAIRDRLAGWGSAVGELAGAAWPTLPDGIVDRPAEVWEPLLAVADAAGGNWPACARDACVSLCQVAEDRQASLGVRLLADIRSVFRDTDALYTTSILNRLIEGNDLDADAPWSDLRGKPLGVRRLATILREYGIRPVKVRELGGRALQGYRRTDLWDAWQRYLPSLASGKAEHPEQLAQPALLLGAGVPDGVPRVPDDSERSETPKRSVTAGSRRNKGDVPDVPDVPDLQGTASEPSENEEFLL